MIIKILWKNSWIFYDGFEKIRYEFIEKNKIDEIDFIDARWDSENSKSSHFLMMIGRKRLENDRGAPGREFTIITNCSVYLLNDEGKTIERIN